MSFTLYIACSVIIVGLSVITYIVSSKNGYDKGYEEGYNFREKLEGSYDTECKVCNHKFNIDKNSVYVVREEMLTGISSIGGGKEPKMFNVIDCPYCGCQHILRVRLRVSEVNEVTTNLKDGEIQIMDLNKN